MFRIALVSCGSTKQSKPAKAKDLYTSTLFKKSREWAEKNADAWFIVSAKHGIVSPDVTIEPYDTTLRGMKSKARREEARQWFDMIEEQLAVLLDAYGYDVRKVTNRAGRSVHRNASDTSDVAILGGKAYTDALIDGTELLTAAKDILKGKQIGERLQWLTEQNNQPSPEPAIVDDEGQLRLFAA